VSVYFFTDAESGTIEGKADMALSHPLSVPVEMPLTENVGGVLLDRPQRLQDWKSTLLSPQESVNRQPSTTSTTISAVDDNNAALENENR
jgi:hypothetical protein